MGRHADGMSEKQVKSIEKLAQNFKMEFNKGQNGTTHESIKKLVNGQWLLVPRPNDRIKVATKAHVMGHFQKKATLERLKEDYYWKF